MAPHLPSQLRRKLLVMAYHMTKNQEVIEEPYFIYYKKMVLSKIERTTLLNQIK